MKGNFLRGKIQTANANYQGLYYPLNCDEAKLTSKHCHQREKHCRKEEKIPSSSWNSRNIFLQEHKLHDKIHGEHES